MIKKLANKFSSLLLSFKKKSPKSAQDTVINSVIDKVTEDIKEVASVTEEAVSKVVETAVQETKKVAKTVETKVPKPASAKPKAAKDASAAPKPKGRPKKTV
jgi:hypothetical protein